MSISAGGGRQIVIPEIVMHDLEVPLHLSGFGIERDDGIAEQIRARAVAAVVVIRSGRIVGRVRRCRARHRPSWRIPSVFAPGRFF